MAWFAHLFRRRHRSTTRQYHVMLPNGTERMFELQRIATVRDLVEVSLLSMSVPSAHHYMFSLTVAGRDGENSRWLRLRKNLRYELKNTAPEVTLHVQVLLYPKSHYAITHKIARHLLYSQICRDLEEKRIRCSNDVAVQLTGLIAQAQLGDYSERTLQNDYMQQLRVVHMSPRHERMAIEQHKLRRGLQIEDCIDEFLTIAEALNGYGSILFDLQDHENRSVVLSCGPIGIEILMGNIQTILIKWDTITVINIRHRTINLQTDSSYTHSFRCPSARLCKHVGLLCVEMRNYNCNSETVQPPSKLRRFLSTRLPRTRQHQPLLHRKDSTLSSISAPVRYHNNSFSNALTLSVDKHNDQDQVNCMSPVYHTRSLSSGSATIPLMDLQERGKSLSPTTPESSPIHLLPTLEEKPSTPSPPSPPFHIPHILAFNPQGEFPTKARTLPARVNPSDVFTLGSLESSSSLDTGSTQDNRYSRYSQASYGKEADNLDCINELLEEGLETVVGDTDRWNGNQGMHHSERYSDGSSDQWKVLMKMNKDKPHRGDRWLQNGLKNDTNSIYPYHSLTMQHPKKDKRNYRSSHSQGSFQGLSQPTQGGTSHSQGNHYNHYQFSELSSHRYHSASSLHRSNGRIAEGIVTIAHQLSLATLSQDSSTYIDPHIRSLVYDSSQVDTETEL